MIQFKLCTEGSCCPVVTINEGFVKISDDYNGQVKLTKAEAKLLLDKLAGVELE